MPIKVFVLADHAVVRAGLRAILESDPGLAVCGEADRSADALEQIETDPPDVAVIDLRRPGADAGEVGREMRVLHSGVSCVIVAPTTLDSALTGGAGSLPADASRDELLDSVRKAGSGSSWSPPPGDRERPEPDVEEQMTRLTDRERRILDLVAEGLTNRQIADRVYLREKTVKNYVSNLLGKLGVRSRTQAAVFLVRHQAQRASD